MPDEDDNLVAGVRKSAIFLLSLGVDQVAEILKRLPSDEVERITREMGAVQHVREGARAAVLDEFCDVARCGDSDESIDAAADRAEDPFVPSDQVARNLIEQMARRAAPPAPIASL